MQIAQVLAGYTLGGADLLRRAMGKKKPEEMAQQRDIFVNGALANGVEQAQATHIFDLMEKFAGYGFNKSHSAAYALLSYQTAWLKAHYPAAFMAAVLSSDMDHTDKVVMLIDECQHIDIAILPPDINLSEYKFTAADQRSIRYGLGAIKGVGQAAIEGVLDERRHNGAFGSIEDFCRRVDLQKSNRRVIEALIRAGAMDALGPNRATIMARLPDALALAEQNTRAAAAGQDDMFGLAAPAAAAKQTAAPVMAADWDEDERLRGEKETLGLYLTGHPIERYRRDLQPVVTASIGELASEAAPENNGERGYGYAGPTRTVIVAGLVMDLRKRGNRVSLILDDRTGRIEVTLFEDAYNRFRTLAVKDNVVVAEGRLGFDTFSNAWRVTAKDMFGVDELRERYVRRLDIHWQAEGVTPEFAVRLKEILKPYLGGRCAVWVGYRGPDASVPVALGDGWRVHPSEALVRKLETWLGADRVALHYGPRVAASNRETADA